jgi:DGQHR domain-containing protein
MSAIEQGQVAPHLQASVSSPKIPVLLRTTTLRRKSPEAVGVMSAADLTRRFEVPRRDFRRRTGYQREISSARVNKLAEDLRKKRVDLPTAVLLNLRDFEESANLLREGGAIYFCPNGAPLYVVDGQHRIEALSKLVTENPAEWSDFQVSFSCMLGASEVEEMEEFYVVNSTAKSVRTDLALDLLKQRAENDPRIMEALLESGQSWKVEAQAMTEDLAKTTLWIGRIRFPGEPKESTTIGSSGMVSSLQELLSNHFFSSIGRAQRIQILDAYWRGLAKILPDVFEDPTAYVMQKSTGVQVMHRILISVLEFLRSRGKSVIDPNSYASALENPLTNLEGDTREGEFAKGAGFWLTGPEGAAGSFSSNAGRRVLTAKIKSTLPVPEVA